MTYGKGIAIIGVAGALASIAFSSTYFAQNDNNGAEYRTRHTIRHHS